MNKNLKRLVAIGTLTGITDIYVNTFLGARIYELASSIRTFAMYYIIQYMCIAATFVIFGSKIKAKPLKALRFGIVLNLILIAFLMLVNENITNYYIPFAMLLGVAQGSYYSPFAVLVSTYNDNSVRYCTISNMLTNIVGIVFPLTIGIYISSTSFRAVTICMLIVSAIQIVLSLHIDNVITNSKCNIIGFLKVLSKSSKVIKYYKIGFIIGMVTSVLDKTVLILIMLIFGSTLQLGILGTVFALFTLITTWLMKRFYKKSSPKSLICYSTGIAVIAVVIMAINVNTWTVIFYKAISSISLCILNLVNSVERYDCLDTELQKEYITEHQALAEVSLDSGRIFGLTILFLLGILI